MLVLVTILLVAVVVLICICVKQKVNYEDLYWRRAMQDLQALPCGKPKEGESPEKTGEKPLAASCSCQAQTGAGWKLIERYVPRDDAPDFYRFVRENLPASVLAGLGELHGSEFEVAYGETIRYAAICFQRWCDAVEQEDDPERAAEVVRTLRRKLARVHTRREA